MILRIIIIILAIYIIQCQLGADLSTLTSKDSFNCLLNSGRKFINARAWKSFAAFDTAAPESLANALAAGYAEQDLGVYMFPCYNQEKSAASQIEQMLQGLNTTRYSTIWIDMQTNRNPGCMWSTDFDTNCQFSRQLVTAAKKSGKKVGIYASNYMWTQIMGGPTKCTRFVDLPLWYAHYDLNPSFEDFTPFGGWIKPQIKQYKGTTSICEASIDFNYRQ